MLIYLFDHVRSGSFIEPDKAQFWHLILILTFSQSFIVQLTFRPQGLQGIMQEGSSLSTKCYLKDVPSEFQRAIVNFLTSSLRQKSIAKLSLVPCIGRKIFWSVFTCIFRIQILTESLEQQLVSLLDYQKFLPNVKSTSVNWGMYASSWCCVIENSTISNKRIRGIWNHLFVFSQSIGSMDYIYTSKFQTSIRQLYSIASVKKL